MLPFELQRPTVPSESVPPVVAAWWPRPHPLGQPLSNNRRLLLLAYVGNDRSGGRRRALPTVSSLSCRASFPRRALRAALGSRGSRSGGDGGRRGSDGGRGGGGGGYEGSGGGSGRKDGGRRDGSGGGTGGTGGSGRGADGDQEPSCAAAGRASRAMARSTATRGGDRVGRGRAGLILGTYNA